MKINRLELLQAVNYNTTVVKDNPLLPANENIHLWSIGDKMKIFTSNSQVLIESEINIEPSEDIKLSVPGIKFAQTIKSLPDEEIKLIVNNNLLDIITSNGKYSLPISDYEFSLPDEEQFTICTLDKDSILDALRRTKHAVDTGEFKTTNVLHIKAESNKLTFVGTNGMILSESSISDIDIHKESIVNIRFNFLASLNNSIQSEYIELLTAGNYLVIKNERNTTYIITTDQKYVKYDSFFNGDHDNIWKIKQPEILSLSKRLKVYTNSMTNQIKFKLSVSSKAIAIDADYGNSGIEDFTSSFEGEEMEVNFSVVELINLISSTKGELTFKIRNSRSPVIVTDENINSRMVIMPMMSEAS